MHATTLALLLAASAPQDEAVAGQGVYPAPPPRSPPILAVEGAHADDESAMRSYTDRIVGTDVTFELLPIPGGTFVMGSPADEDDREKSEGPQRQVTISPFWMGRYEVTWDEYHLFMLRIDHQLRGSRDDAPAEQDRWADAVSRPTPPYVPMDFNMGVEGCPAVCMTQFAAKQYCKWLSMKTGRFYRLPTEAEWEYACRAGTSTAYSFGDDPDDLDGHAWYFDNADDSYHPVGQLKPNPWGLYDMHGNVCEWVLDSLDKTAYAALPEEGARDPLNWPVALYPRCVRGGGWDHDPEQLRSAARLGSKKGWKVQDPQLPKSIWYHTDASWLGFRLVRPLVEPSAKEKARFWETDLEEVREIEEKQRLGGR